MFRVVAERWWKNVKTPYDTMKDAKAWETFTKKFHKKFIPKDVRAQKLVEFELLA